MSEESLDATLDSMRNVAAQVHRCPACHSERIYTAVHVAYIFDHHKNRLEPVPYTSLAEHGCHGCFACGHQWVSNPMMKTAMQPTSSEAASNIIDLRAFKNKR